MSLSAFLQLSEGMALGLLFSMKTFLQSLASFRTPPSHSPLYLGVNNSKEKTSAFSLLMRVRRGRYLMGEESSYSDFQLILMEVCKGNGRESTQPTSLHRGF